MCTQILIRLLNKSIAVRPIVLFPNGADMHADFMTVSFDG